MRRGDHAKYVCTVSRYKSRRDWPLGKSVGLHTDDAKQQRGRAFCRPDSGDTTHRKPKTGYQAGTRCQRATWGSVPGPGLLSMGCPSQRYCWYCYRSVVSAYDEGPARPEGCSWVLALESAEHTAAVSVYPLWASWGDLLLPSVGSKPMAFGSAAWRCGLQTLHAVVSEKGRESGLGGSREILQRRHKNRAVEGTGRWKMRLPSHAPAPNCKNRLAVCCLPREQRPFTIIPSPNAHTHNSQADSGLTWRRGRKGVGVEAVGCAAARCV